MLTNKLVAELSQFGDIYRVLNDSAIYYKDLNTKLLSHDLGKLHPTILLLYRILKLHKIMSDKNSTYGDVLGKVKGKVYFLDAHNLFEEIRSIKALNFGEFLSEFSKHVMDERCDANLRLNLLDSLSVRLKDEDEGRGLYAYLLSKIKDLMIKPSGLSLEENEEKNKVDALLNIDLAQWQFWVDFIDREEEGKDFIFHTYHGTKGEEYENVAIIMEHSFGGGWQGSNKFKNFFLKASPNKEQVSSEEKNEVDVDFENTKNLLYVACSRAIKNLRILYIGDIEEIQSGIKSIFGETIVWKAASV